MIYFTSLAILLALICLRNPLRIHEKIHIRWSLLIVSCFLIQIIMAFAADKMQEKWEEILVVTFIGIIVGLWMNRNIPGVKWILTGATLNLLAILIHGGLMPVSETAMKVAGQNLTGFEGDSRHQLLQESPFWIITDWIPIPPYVMSIGDIFVGIGIVFLISINSPSFKTILTNRNEKKLPISHFDKLPTKNQPIK